MADNRIYLRCLECKEILFLGKTFGDGYIFENYNGQTLKDKLNEFYAKHHHYDGCLDWFDIEYENEEYKPKMESTLEGMWKKVNDFSPPEGEALIVSAYKNGIFKTFGNAILKDKQWFLHGLRLDWTVTHWMNLPQPAPAEDEEDL